MLFGYDLYKAKISYDVIDFINNETTTFWNKIKLSGICYFKCSFNEQKISIPHWQDCTVFKNELGAVENYEMSPWSEIM